MHEATIVNHSAAGSELPECYGIAAYAGAVVLARTHIHEYRGHFGSKPCAGAESLLPTHPHLIKLRLAWFEWGASRRRLGQPARGLAQARSRGKAYLYI